MKKKTFAVALCAALTALVAVSCHLSGTSYDADSYKGYEEAVKVIQKNTDPKTCKIYYMKLESSQPQANKLETVTIKYVMDIDKAFSKKILLLGQQVVMSDEGLPRTFEAPVFKDVKGIDMSHFDAKKVEDQINQAKALIPKGGKFKAVYDYCIEEAVPAGNDNFNSEYQKGEQTISFNLSFTQKGPDGKEGISVVRVLVDKSGKAKFDI